MAVRKNTLREDCFSRDCVKEKKLNFCGECQNFPCDTIMTEPRSTVLDKDWLAWNKKSKSCGSKNTIDPERYIRGSIL